jgi:hypothetical protein
MGCETAEVLAAACGLSIAGPFWGRGAQFHFHLADLIKRHELEVFFGHYPIEGLDHLAVRPRGIDWDDGSQTLAREMKAWRDAYRASSSTRKMLVSSILWMYRGSADDKVWMQD